MIKHTEIDKGYEHVNFGTDLKHTNYNSYSGRPRPLVFTANSVPPLVGFTVKHSYGPRLTYYHPRKNPTHSHILCSKEIYFHFLASKPQCLSRTHIHSVIS